MPRRRSVYLFSKLFILLRFQTCTQISNSSTENSCIPSLSFTNCLHLVLWKPFHSFILSDLEKYLFSKSLDSGLDIVSFTLYVLLRTASYFIESPSIWWNSSSLPPCWSWCISILWELLDFLQNKMFVFILCFAHSSPQIKFSIRNTNSI